MGLHVNVRLTIIGQSLLANNLQPNRAHLPASLAHIIRVARVGQGQVVNGVLAGQGL
jgi:hypothetical protein